MLTDISDLSNSILSDAVKVLAYTHQCSSLAARACRLCMATKSSENDFIEVLRDIQLFFTKLQNKTEVLKNWLKHDNSAIVKFHVRLNEFDSEVLTVIESDVDQDESELRSFVENDLREYRTLELNESRVFNDEMSSNLEFIRSCSKEEADGIELREINVGILKIETERTHFLGAGAFGSVRKGWFKGMEVAVKQVLDANDDETYDLYCLELAKEARILQVHSFPGVVRMFGVNKKDKPTLLVMELAVCSLYSALHEKKHKIDLSENRKVELLHSMCSTLSFLHSVGIVHRDIKSRNFLMMSDGSVKVADFGLSKANVVEKSVGNNLKGTHAYLAPELMMQTNPPFVYSEATDMYAFGILMNEVMTGSEPFKGLSERVLMTLMMESDGVHRPPLYDGSKYNVMVDLISSCWDVNVLKREDFFQLCFHIGRSLDISAVIDNIKTTHVEKVFLASDAAGYYTGQMKGNKKHGDGILKCLNGLRYAGTWKNNQLNGFGRRKGLDFEYEGGYVNSSREGHGIAKYANGDVYKGLWSDNLFNGCGKYKFADGNKFNGMWKNNSMEGKGIMKYANGDVYDGEWQKNGKQGHGVMRYANGDVYDGEWKNGEMDGHGVMNFAVEKSKNVLTNSFVDMMAVRSVDVYFPIDIVVDSDDEEVNVQVSNRCLLGDINRDFEDSHRESKYANGDVYDGNWISGEMEGHGVMNYANGDVYDGEWKHNGMDGPGKLTRADGTCFCGEWKGYCGDGHGLMLFAHGVYQGDLAHGDRNGDGVMNYLNGDIYDGQWKDNARQGHGVMKYANGDVYDGEWKIGKMRGNGVMRYANGDVYDGEWRKNIRHGCGVMTYANGNVYYGEWHGDLRQEIVSYTTNFEKSNESNDMSTKSQGSEECCGAGWLIRQLHHWAAVYGADGEPQSCASDGGETTSHTR